MKAEEAWLSFSHMGPVGQVYASAPAQFVIAPAPAGSKGNGSIAGAWGMGITAGTEKLEAAQAFIEYMASPDVLYKVTQGIGGTIPPVQEVVDVLGSEPADEVVKMGLITLEAGIPHGVPASDYTDWSAVKTVYDETFKKIWDDMGVVDADYLVSQQAALEALLVD
jgi:multiple sugar transport system substrate-binding protein